MSLAVPKLGDAPSRRESQVAIAILFGRTRTQTARELGIGMRTVDTYRERLYRKFGAHNNFQLVRALMQFAPE